MNWERLQVEGDVLAFAISLAFERYKGNSTYKNFEISWLWLNDALYKENDRLNLTNYRLQQNVKVRESPRHH